MGSCFQMFFLSGFAYCSEPNNAQKMVRVEHKFDLKLFVLVRFYCIYIQ